MIKQEDIGTNGYICDGQIIESKNVNLNSIVMVGDRITEEEWNSANIIKDLTNKNKELQNCYDNNLQLYKQQERQINKLATVIERISKVLEIYFDDDNRATREIERIINEVTTK